jgi:enamine deaminase RidA (YjgF/YER057c/UK114 family)
MRRPTASRAPSARATASSSLDAARSSPTPGDAAAQARRCCAIIAEAVAALGGGRVIRTRLFLTDPADGDGVGAVHKAAFGADAPAATMVFVSALARPEWRVEIEAEAVAA